MRAIPSCVALGALGLLLAACPAPEEMPRPDDVEDDTVDADPPPTFVPGPWTARRLTRDQLVYLLDDVMGVRLTADELTSLPSEVPAEGFTSHDIALVTTPEHVSAWFDLAASVSQRLDPAELVAQHAPCTEQSPTCTEGFVRSLGGALMRRPVRDDEATRYAGLFAAAAAEDLGFEDGATLVVEALLQSPGVLYQIEDERPDGPDSAHRTLSDHELASRLAMLLHRSAPDPQLAAAADAGELHTEAQIATHVDRLLADDVRMQRASERFARDWLVLDRLIGLRRSDVDPGTPDRLREAALRSWSHHVLTLRAPVVDVLDSPVVVLHDDLGPWYGGWSGEAWTAVEVDDPMRVGALSWPGVLASTADRDLGGMVARGLYVREHLLCKSALHPPDDLDLSAFTTHLGPGATERAYSEDCLADGACAGCHLQFDPLAYGLEPFDGMGRFAATNEAGSPLRSDGWVPSRDGNLPYTDPAGLGAALASTEEVQRCITQKHLAFALGRPLVADDAGAIHEIHERASDAGGSFHDLLRAIATHPVVRTVDTSDGSSGGQ